MGFAGSPVSTISIGGPVNYYYNYTATTLYVEKPFGEGVNSLTISNDSDTDTISVSYDGATLEAELMHGESITLNVKTQKSIFIRGAVGGDQVRIWAS